MDNDETYRRARRRAQETRGFYRHLGTYLLVNLLLFAINMITMPDALWFYWPLLGWGVGLAAHAFRVFVIGGNRGDKWEERNVQEIIAEERAKKEEQGRQE
jgi:hypothetical protein